MATKKTKGKPSTTTKIDEAAGTRAFEALRGTLEALSRDELLPVRLDVQRAAAIAHSVGLRDASPERRARLVPLAQSGAFSLADFELLPEAARAAWYARQQQQRHAAASSDALVPPAIVKDGYLVRGRMLRVLEHYFDDAADHAPQLAAIRAGTGLQDLANDLEQLAALYAEPQVRALASKDPKHWQDSDVQTARRLAEAIFRGLGLGEQGEAAKWADLAQRAWTLLSRTYEEVRAIGRFAFRNHEDVESTYPSLVTATRGPTRPTATDDDGGEEEEPEPPEPEPTGTTSTPEPSVEL